MAHSGCYFVGNCGFPGVGARQLENNAVTYDSTHLAVKHGKCVDCGAQNEQLSKICTRLLNIKSLR